VEGEKEGEDNDGDGKGDWCLVNAKEVGRWDATHITHDNLY